MAFASNFNIQVPLKENRALVYNSLSGAMAVLESDEKEILEGLQKDSANEYTSKILNEFHSAGFMTGDQADEFSNFEQQYLMHRFDANTLTLTIAPTMACNFGCDYCFQGKDKPSNGMPQNVQDAIVGLVEQSISSISRLHITWYGGEPLIKYSIIKDLSERIIRICDTHSVEYDSMIVTNGYLLDPDTARSLAGYRIYSAQITLDGSRNTHDATRATLSGAPSFDRILQNAKQIIQADIPIRFSVRVNVDIRNQDEITRLFDELVQYKLTHTNRFQIYFAPIEALTKFCAASADVSLEKSIYGKLEVEYIEKAIQLGLSGHPLPPRFRGSCAAVKPNGFVVTSNGDIYKCWDAVNSPEKKIGTIFNIEKLTLNTVHQNWLNWSPFNVQMYRNCRLLPSCAGACAFKFG